jgi:hypothetical protein
VYNLAKIIYVLLKQRYDIISEEKLFENLYMKIMPKLKIDTISKINYNN